jgi:hypothetical protein
MNKKAVFGMGLSLFFAFLVISVNSAFAVTTFTEHVSAGGAVRVYVSGHPEIMLVIDRCDSSPYGPSDRIQMWVSANETGFGGPFRPVVAYEDNPVRSVFSVSLKTGIMQNVVKPGQIQVLRVGKSSTIMVHWNIPLVAPALPAQGRMIPATPAVTLPPGKLVFQGYGEPYSGSGQSRYPAANINASISTAERYDATVTFFCQSWNYKWLPIAEYGNPYVITDRTWTWALP